MALAAPLRSDGPWGVDPTRAARIDRVAPHEVHFYDIAELEPKTGRPEWGRAGFIFSARIVEHAENGRYVLDTPHGRLSAAGDAELPVPAVLRLRVERNGDLVVLRLAGPASVGGRSPASDVVDVASLLRTLGLPVDAVSSALLSFFRAFGLRLDGAEMRSLRSAVLRFHADGEADREAAALAAAAAASKGVRLSDEALAEYAAAIAGDPGRGRGGGELGGRDPGEKRRGRSSNEDDRAESEASDGEALAASFRVAQDGGGVVSFLNALPGRDGDRWIVFPVSISSKPPDGDAVYARKVEIRAVVRILLLAAHGVGAGRVGRWVVETAIGGRAWSFDAGREENGLRVLYVSSDPPLGDESSRVREALEPMLTPLGYGIVVSDAASVRFPDRKPDLSAAFDAEA